MVMVVVLVGLAVFIGSNLFSSNSRDNESFAKQKEMMALVLEQGRLAPFPVTATNVLITTEGNLFTRSFRASFIAPKQDIQAWVKDSPGLNQNAPMESSENVEIYSVAPDDGANSVEVKIDYALGKVEIYVSWS
jgi:hypothetical protein